MKSIFKHKNKIIPSTLFAIITLSVLTLAWILFIPLFNITHIRKTLAHKSEVTDIIEQVINPRGLTDEAPEWKSFNVRIVYGYTPTCIMTFAVVEGPVGNSRGFYVFEINQVGDWQMVQAHDNQNDILPTRSSDLGCTNGD